MRYLSGLLACTLLIVGCGTKEVETVPAASEPVVEEALPPDDVPPATDKSQAMGDWRDDLPEVIATVGTTEIGRDAFLEELTLARAAVQARTQAAGQQFPASFSFDEEAGLRLMQSLVDNELLEQYARAQGSEVSEDELGEAITRGKAAFESEEAYLESLSRQKLTPETVRARVERRLLIGKLIESRVSDLEADDARVKAKYQELLGTGAFDVPESVTISQIYVPASTDEENEKAEAALQKAYDDITAGGAFLAVAEEVTAVQPEARVAEKLTAVRGRMDADLEKTVFGTAVGELVPPFQTADGWHLLKVGERLPARSLSLEEVRPRLEEHVLFPDQEAAFLALVEEAIKEIPVELHWQPTATEQRSEAAPVEASNTDAEAAH